MMGFTSRINIFTLAFSDKSLEKHFRREIMLRSLLWFRVVFISGIILYPAMSAVDFLIFPEMAVKALCIKVIALIPVFVALALTFAGKSEWYLQYGEYVNLLGAVSTSVGVIMIVCFSRNVENINLHIFSLSLTNYYIYLLIRARFSHVLVSTGVLSCVMFVCDIVVLHDSVDHLLVTGPYLLASYISGCFLAWLIEYHSRSRFLLHGKLARMSRRDFLTGAHSRYYFDQILRPAVESHAGCRLQSISERRQNGGGGMSYAMLLLDLDHFKRVNDQYGHNVGDETLQCFVRAVYDVLASQDYLIRWGGEEFVVLCPGKTEKELPALLRAVGEAVASLLLKSGEERVAVSCSIGATIFPDNGAVGFDESFEIIDGAMYCAKKAGRDCACIILKRGGENQMVFWSDVALPQREAARCCSSEEDFSAEAGKTFPPEQLHVT